MNRREFLGNAAVLSAAAMTGSVGAASAEPGGTTSPDWWVTDPAVLPRIARVRDAAAQCDAKANTCIQHCQEQLGRGETTFSRCSASSHQMQAICASVSRLAAFKSPHLRSMLGACLAACKACKEACEEHKAHWAHGMHLECKECAEACEATIAAVAELQANWKG